MATPNYPTWRKTSRSNGQGGECIEIGSAPGWVGIRDTKNRDGGTLVVDRAVFGAFLAAVKRH
ncbi:DUF397 domain-containing protein [Actinoalloteichus hymeniacidonis]|uniref:DUF397 family protein n=1 Tax=Actinoalloteichus hymeniacidonis TaxID=340345 RepID=A0AAC9MZT5_9PSEU|nr:DUF397 domain-containing protein [Actinoalloteichus hymeniacidonis]AOS64799.1 putative DUF397 family protein [Actinoalloteichus hymeniacidonis]MBB5907127.1 hypothetical protein [Actinoalloteichus hymeniacidonis]